MNDFKTQVRQDPYASHLGICFDRMEQGFAECSLTIKENMLNFLGLVHGGLVFSLADAAFSAASNHDHTPSYALDISGSFLRSARPGDTVRAEAVLVHSTRRTALYRMTVMNGNDLMATFNGTVIRMGSDKKPEAVEHGQTGVWTEPLTGMVFVSVPGGSFLMGDASGEGLENERPVHEVALCAFHMSKTPVTRKQWAAVMGEDSIGDNGKPDDPVTYVTFSDAESFISILNERSDGTRFSLPTEAQWEYAARSAGKNQLYAGSGDAKQVAWTGENSDGHLHAVALKKANELGLYDMSGNVWEWCLDAFDDEAYENHEPRNPLIMGEKGRDRVARGGSWLMDAWSARCTRRFSFPEDVSGNGLGFRLVMTRDAA